MTKPFTLHLGDCIEVMKTLPDNSVDSVVTDPPYELGFMGKKWDASGIAYHVDMWAEAMRVLKPGGHLLAFSGSRTYHRMTYAIEDAGFEIRDQIMWVYGSGFPKSLDVSKAIDKAGGSSPADQAAILRQKREDSGLSREQVAAQVGCTVSSVRDWEEGRARATGAAIEFIVPSEDYRAKLADLLGYSTDERRIVGVAADRRDAGTGSAARFFYCTKTSRADRNAGLPTGAAPAVSTNATMREREDADWPARNGNHHPTVKPTDLMAYLCRLVTQPGGVVLDPFMGSGSTGKAAMREGFQFVGIEMEPQYMEIATARIQHELNRVEAERAAAIKAKAEADAQPVQLSLID